MYNICIGMIADNIIKRYINYLVKLSIKLIK